MAAAEVLKSAPPRKGDEENAKGLKLIIVGALAAAAFTLVAKTRLLAEEAAHYFHVGVGARPASRAAFPSR